MLIRTHPRCLVARFLLVVMAMAACAPTAFADMLPESINARKIKNGPVPLYKEGTHPMEKLMTLRDGQIVSFEDTLNTDPAWSFVSTWDDQAGKNRKGWVKTEYLAPIRADKPFTQSVGEVISRTATLRDGPSTDAPKILTLNNGAQFLFIRHVGDWAFVHFDAKDSSVHEGYVRSELVVENAEHLVCKSGDIPAYAYPSRDAKTVSVLGQDTRLTLLAELDDFWVVSLRTASACISKDSDVYVEERKK